MLLFQLTNYLRLGYCSKQIIMQSISTFLKLEPSHDRFTHTYNWKKYLVYDGYCIVANNLLIRFYAQRAPCM